MQFVRLGLAGFKSFVDPAELEIAPGLTGVVGPNGCGKSNLVEALRWTMGESSARRMRGDAMDDVIFGGSASRPAREVAEVVLTIDNAGRTAPAALNDAPELEVARRIERGKGSVYRVNGREARGRDVQLLFADAGTGARSASIVGQGRIGALIAAKPSERRALLEEAANVRGLNARRREAEQRLRAAEDNLERLEDVLNALRAQLDGLRRQARQAARYRKLGARIREAEAALFRARRAALEAARDEAAGALRAAEAAVGAATGEAARESARRADLAARTPALRRADAEAAARSRALELARGELDGEQARVAAARSETETRLGQIAGDIGREEALAEEAREAVAALAAERAAIEAAREGEAARADGAAERLAEAGRRAEAAEGRIAALTERIAVAEARRAALERQARLAEARRADLSGRLDALEREEGALRAGAAAPGALEAAERAAEGAAARLEAVRAGAEAAEEERASRGAAAEAARGALAKAEAEAAGIATEAGSLRDMLARDAPAGAAPVLDRLAVAAGYETALGAALGDDLAAPLAGDGGKDGGEDGGNSGGAPGEGPDDGGDGFRRGWTGNGARAAAPALPEGAEPLDRAVSGPAELALRLASVGVARDAEAARALQPSLAPGQRLTTRAGGLWRWDGFVEAPGAPGAAALRLARRNRLSELAGLSEEAAGRRAAAAHTLAGARDARERAVERERSAREALRQARSGLEAARARLAEGRALMAERDGKLAAIAEARARLAAEREEALEQKSAAEAERAGLEDVPALRAAAAGERRDLAERREELDTARAAHDRLVREARDRRARLAAIGTDTAAWAERMDRARARARDLAARRDSEAAELEKLAARPAEIAARREKLVEALAAAEAARRRAADSLAAAEAALEKADAASRAADRAVAAAREERVRAESGLARADEALALLRERVAERLGGDPGDALDAPDTAGEGEPPDIDATEARLERLSRERERIGPVNLRAEAEATELEERIAGMENERDDLAGAIARLRRAIAALNREGRDRLEAAFEKVNGHFQRLFVQLFGGGRARLALVEADDPLEAGLEVVASPPGKTPRTLSLLSGGEQALAALALVFAAFLTNPAPACVLDEVDAPLDDSNVDRFCDLLDEIARDTGTRFLVVTHHRLTMARMDRLYGVTMAERGVSRLVSVDLAGAAALRESPRPRREAAPPAALSA